MPLPLLPPSPRRALRRPRRAAALAAVAVASLVLGACGSQVDPRTAAMVNGDSSLASADTGSGPGDAGGPVTDGGVGQVDTTGGDASASGTTSGGGSAAGTTGAAGGSDGAAAADGSSGAGGSAGAGRSTGATGASAADCAGLADQTGVTKDAITIANISDISGPVPGVFQAAQDGANAYAAYVNASGGLCGRRLKVLALDSRADSGANQVAYARACEQAFASVGSMSVFDDGAATAGKCGLPDLHALTVSKAAFECRTCFGAASINPGLQLGAMAKFVKAQYRSAAQRTAVLYVNVAGVADAAQALAASWKKVGIGIRYVQAIEVAEFNYAPYVQRLKQEGIEVVHYIGPYQFTIRLQQAMRQQGFTPKAFIQDQTIYDQKYVDEAGENGNGTVVYTSVARYDDATNKEMRLYLQWLQQVRPGATPTIYGVFAWSATRLFVERAAALGGRLTRPALVTALSRVGEWTGNGIHGAQDVGGKTTGECIRVIQLGGGRWKQISPGDYYCAPNIRLP